MASASTVAQSIRLFVAQNTSPQARSAMLATAARYARDALIVEGRAAATFDTFVDGREGASEDTVRPDGVILYRFSQLGQAAVFALNMCRTRSPVESGRFRNSWFVSVDGSEWKGNLLDIPSGSTVMISNHEPYWRKIDVGAMKMSVPPQIVEAVRTAGRRQFPLYDFERVFVSLSGGQDGRGGPVPYALKGQGKRRSQSRGTLMTYPALMIIARG